MKNERVESRFKHEAFALGPIQRRGPGNRHSRADKDRRTPPNPPGKEALERFCANSTPINTKTLLGRPVLLGRKCGSVDPS